MSNKEFKKKNGKRMLFRRTKIGKWVYCKNCGSPTICFTGRIINETMKVSQVNDIYVKEFEVRFRK